MHDAARFRATEKVIPGAASRERSSTASRFWSLSAARSRPSSSPPTTRTRCARSKWRPSTTSLEALRERIALAVDRARTRRAAGMSASVEGLRTAARPEASPLARIVVRDGSRVHIIPADRLDAAEAQDDDVALKTEGRTYLKPQTLTSLAAGLDPARFGRVHRSHLLRLDALARLEPMGAGGPVAVLADGSRIRVSREGYARLRERLG